MVVLVMVGAYVLSAVDIIDPVQTDADSPAASSFLSIRPLALS